MGIYSRYWHSLPLLKTFPAFSPLLVTLMTHQRMTDQIHPPEPPPLAPPDPDRLHRLFSNPDHQLKVHAEHRGEGGLWVIRTDTYIGNKAQASYESFPMDLKCAQESLVGIHEESKANGLYFAGAHNRWVQDYWPREGLRVPVIARNLMQFSPSFVSTRGIIPDFDIRKTAPGDVTKKTEAFLASFDDNSAELTEQLHQYGMQDDMGHLLGLRRCLKYMAFRPIQDPYEAEEPFTIYGFLPMAEVLAVDTAKDYKEMKTKMAALDFMANYPILCQNLRAQNVQEDMLMNHMCWGEHNRPLRPLYSSRWENLSGGVG